jgi:large subunit ribosomal protein L1
VWWETLRRRLPDADILVQVLSGEISPTKVIATPDLVPVIAPKLARFLGQKGLMPTAKRGTVREDIAEAVREAKGLLDWKGDKQGHVRAAVARVSVTTGRGS